MKQEQILREVRRLQEELAAIRHLIVSDRHYVEMMLRRRGFREVKYAPVHHCVLPPGCSKEAQDTFYRLMKKYSFRIFLRDLLTYVHTPRPELLTRYCSERVARQYLAILLEHEILRQTSSSEYAFTVGPSPFFGDTLEWFVARVMQREFGSPASWGIRLKDSDTGGDYDVIASIEEHFVYIEVKSSPPKHIEPSEIKAFMDRGNMLRPEMAIFLEDTHLRMKDKLVGLFEEEFRRRYGKDAPQKFPVHRLHHETFTINNRIFLTNSKPGIITNLGICLRHFLIETGNWKLEASFSRFLDDM